jgi:hypothetical protein
VSVILYDEWASAANDALPLGFASSLSVIITRTKMPLFVCVYNVVIVRTGLDYLHPDSEGIVFIFFLNIFLCTIKLGPNM